MNKQNFYSTYYGIRKNLTQFKDNYREGIELLPTESNENHSSFKIECGLNGVTGEFMRILQKRTIAPISDAISVRNSMKKYFEESEDFVAVDPEKKKILVDIATELLFSRSKMSILDASFFALIPLTGQSVDREKIAKYEDGQKKLANYLIDMLGTDYISPRLENGNLLSQLLKKAVCHEGQPWSRDFNRKYTIHPEVIKSFRADLTWFIEKHSDIILIQYLPLLLYFYVCHGIIQMVQALDPTNADILAYNKVHSLYYFVEGETASAAKPAVEKGWHRIAKDVLPSMLGRLQALDILNSILEPTPDTSNVIGFYPEVMAEFQKTPWDDVVKEDCEEVLNNYQKDKKEMLSNRKDSNRDLASIPDDVFTINSYEDFVKSLYRLCCSLNTRDYIPRFANKISDILKLRLLQNRRGYQVLVLDEEMLLFIFALATKEKKTLLKDAYEAIDSYGISFSHETRQRIESQLLKMNLLDRKSDAGEAQYVTVLL